MGMKVLDISKLEPQQYILLRAMLEAIDPKWEESTIGKRMRLSNDTQARKNWRARLSNYSPEENRQAA